MKPSRMSHITLILLSAACCTVLWTRLGMAGGDPDRQHVYDELRTRSLQLVNTRGEVVARIESAPQGYPGFAIAIGDNDVAVFSILVNPNGNVQIIQGDSKGNSRITTTADVDGTASVTFGSKTRQDRTVLGRRSDGSTFAVVDELVGH